VCGFSLPCHALGSAAALSYPLPVPAQNPASSRASPHSPPQALAQGLASGGGTATAVAEATAQAYSSQPQPVANALADAIKQANADPSQVGGAGPEAGWTVLQQQQQTARPWLVMRAGLRTWRSPLVGSRRAPAPPNPPPQVDAASATIAKALAAGGNQAKVFSAALASAVASGGCGSIANILSSEQGGQRMGGAKGFWGWGSHMLSWVL
jgi:hypothetical protein